MQTARLWQLIILISASALSLPAQPAGYPSARHGGAYMHNYYIPPAPGTTPWAPCWSPDGQWIALAMQGSIWKLDPRAGIAVELTHTAAYASSPAWSPDGKWIVYTADYDSRRIQLEALDLATGQAYPLTEDQQVYLDAVFSPDGTRLAYVSTQPRGYFNIYIRAIRDGRWDGDPVAVTTDNAYPRDRLYFGRWDMHLQPAWTPDGKELVFISNREAPLGSGDLWRAPAAPDGMRQAVRILQEQTLYRTRPHVSPDGRRIVYASTAGAADQFNHLYLVPLSGGAPYKLTFGSCDHFHPRWSPDGQSIAYTSNEDGLPQLCLLEVWGGKQQKIRIQERQWKRPMGRLHVRVVDAATKRLVAARIHGMAAGGKHYAPFDSYARINAIGRHYFHAPGEFTVEAPPGRMTFEAVRGFEYRPAQQEVEIQPDRTTSATLLLRRIVDMPARGWHSGSTHVHMNYGGNLHNTPDNLAMMASAEDLHLVNALVANKDNRVLDWQYFQPNRREYPLLRPVPGVKILFGEEYRPAFHGHSFLLGLRDHLVSPFPSNYEGTALDSLYPSNTDIFRKAKAQGGITGYVHPALGPPSAFPVDAALGTLDALEWSAAVRAQMEMWGHALNNDIPLVPVGGEDSINDLHRLKTLGAVRTYVHLDGPLSASAWLEGLAKGRTFFSTGPLLDFRVNGRLPGDVIRLPAAGGAVTIEGTVWSLGRLSKVVVNHRRGVLREIPLDAQGAAAHFKDSIQVTESDWFSLAAEGPQDPRLDATYLLAATNTVRVYVGDQKIRDRAAAEYFIRWIDKLREQTEKWPWWASQSEKEHVLAQYEEARRVYQRFIQEAP